MKGDYTELRRAVRALCEVAEVSVDRVIVVPRAAYDAVESLVYDEIEMDPAAYYIGAPWLIDVFTN